MLWIRAALMMVSFAGLCAGVRVVFRVDKYVAPAIAACSVITLLNLAGMVGLLFPAWVALYCAGFLGALYAYAVRRSAPDPLLLMLYGLFVPLLVLRFAGSSFYANDDVSHWALVARHLLRYDAFPDRAANYVNFQSYPLGAACFIYYVGRGTVNTEGLFLIAQYFLHGALFAPVLACVRRDHRGAMTSFCVASFVFLLHFSDKMVTIQVDHLLGFFGILICALLCLYGKDLRRLALTLLPCLMAVTVVKNSGLVFSIAAALCVLVAGRRNKRRSPSRPPYLGAVAAVGILPVAHYLLWTLRLRLVYANALQTKHAVGLSAYMTELRQKGLRVVAQITAAYCRMLVTPSKHGLLCAAYVALCAVLIARLAAKRKRLAAGIRKMALNLCVYLAWVALVYGMYLVSMPTDEALRVASFSRYQTTGLIVLMGLFLLDLQAEWSAVRKAPKAMAVLLRGAAILCLTAVFALYAVFAVGGRHSLHFSLNTQPSSFRAALHRLKDEQGLADGATYLVCYPSPDDHSLQRYYEIKYEFETGDIYAVCASTDTGRFIVGTWADKHEAASPLEFMREHIDLCDACIILTTDGEPDPLYGDFVDGYGGKTPIYMRALSE